MDKFVEVVKGLVALGIIVIPQIGIVILAVRITPGWVNLSYFVICAILAFVSMLIGARLIRETYFKK